MENTEHKIPQEMRMEKLKKQFLRMRTPSAFGSIRRFDSNTFMNIPPEMARRDAAYSQLERIIQETPFRESVEERRRFYTLAINRMELIIEKTALIHNANLSEKRNLEKKEVLLVLQQIARLLVILDSMADSQTTEAEENISQTLFGEELVKTIDLLDDRIELNERNLYLTIRHIMHEFKEQLDSLRAEYRPRFSKSDSERYERALAFYSEYFADIANY